MAFFCEAGVNISDTEKGKKGGWREETEQDLYRYARYEHAIRRLELRLGELTARMDDGRRIVSAVPDVETGFPAIRRGVRWRGGSGMAFEEYIVTEVADIMGKIGRMTAFREMMEMAVDYEFTAEPEKKAFIRLYYWAGLSKGDARREAMKKLHLSRQTSYNWQENIVSRMARVLGHGEQ